ncbi:MAG: hypothetical protein CME71_09510 [Halobacteriovorax sp.]|nr:hypothetical protein [Halobacteriovorax sp.]
MISPIPLYNFNKDSPRQREILFYSEWKENLLQVRYEIQPTDNVVWPIQQTPVRKYELWKSTCFEFFLSRKSCKEYLEFNISPSGSWDAYTFLDYRTPSQPVRYSAVELLEFNQTPNAITACFKFLDSEIKSKCEANITAVIEDDLGLHYYAHKHASDKPDFHHRPSVCIEFN